MEDIIELKGKEIGSTSMILVGVHGNERCGIDAIEALLPTLSIQKGTVLIGYGNPRAIEQNVRFTKANLNRMFKPDELLSDEEKRSYEYQRAQILKSYFDQSEALLDIHASLTPESRVFAICEPNANEIMKYLPIPLVVSGFDQVEPGGTDYYMNKIGKVGICIECGYLSDQSATAIATNSITAFLAAREHIAGAVQEQMQSYIHMYELYFTKTDSFTLVRQFADFEEVESGELIGMDGDEEVRTPKDSIILFARNRTRKGEEGFLLGVYKKA